MDDLTHLRARLRELVDAKIERIAALRSEITAIELELDEAKSILSAWGTPVVISAPPAARIETRIETEDERFERRRRERKEKRAAHVIKMPRPAVIEYLQAVGPQEGRRILEHFEVGPRGVAVFQVWANSGHLVRHADGRYAAPSTRTASADIEGRNPL